MTTDTTSKRYELWKREDATPEETGDLGYMIWDNTLSEAIGWFYTNTEALEQFEYLTNGKEEH